jgi:hypothetical protein
MAAGGATPACRQKIKKGAEPMVDQGFRRLSHSQNKMSHFSYFTLILQQSRVK